MGRKVAFNVTKIGASHLESGKPCQDYSLSWESDNKQVQVVVVCDGHGGDTYVRSDIGSRLAAETALTNIRNFVSSVSPALFIGKCAAITARPDEEYDTLFPISKRTKNGELTEIEQQQYEQDKTFYAAVEHVREQDALFLRLFASIYMQWMAEIRKDAETNPFTEIEKACLKDAPVQKAYGSTLMAFVRTPLYWFAFHIGDGKLLGCDRNFDWREPVPWDYNCFLNITTSLCNSNPIPMFRYAFSGKGDFPIAVILGSDGLDDSWGTIENLQNFYSQVLTIFSDLGEEKALEELGDYLPKLSKKGSRDDMSVAGIIDMDEIKNGIAVYKVRREINLLKQKQEIKETELLHLKRQCEQLQQEIKTLCSDIKQGKDSMSAWWHSIENVKDEKNKRLLLKEDELKKKQQMMEKQELVYKEKAASWKVWFEKTKQSGDVLATEYKSLRKQNETKEKEDLKLWEQAKDAFVRQETLARQTEIKEKADRMEQCNEEALKALLENSGNQENIQEEIQNEEEQ